LLTKIPFNNETTASIGSLALTAILATVIALATLTPLAELAPKPPGGDKFHHFVAFAALTLPTALLYPRALIWLLPTAIAYGGCLELIQPYVNRWGEWGDFVADSLGAILGVVLGLSLRFAYSLMATRK